MRERGVTKVFGKEIKNLIIILIIFSSSFLIRWVYDTWLSEILTPRDNTLCTDADGNEMLCKPFEFCIDLLWIQYIWDFIPFGGLLFVHYKNFRTIKDDSDSTVSSIFIT